MGLPGFLGKPQDWTALFSGHTLEKFLTPHDYFNGQPVKEMAEWAVDFNLNALKNFGIARRRILLGYSLGGRLSMHALLQDPVVWHAAVIVSAHLGIVEADERKIRAEVDEKWAVRFEKDNWHDLMTDWNRQSVFSKDTFCFDRQESDYSREALAATLRCWSLSRQQDLFPLVSQLEIPILWVVGAEDVKYAIQAKRLEEAVLRHPLSRVWIVPGSGHRVPWNYKKEFLTRLCTFFGHL